MEQVYLAPCTEYQYEPLKQAVDDIFDHLALNRFLFQGANVVIKPNLLMKCNPDTAIITHPLLVAAVGTKVKELGGKVTIAESSGGRYTPSTVKNIYQACGYTNMAQQYGFLLNTDCSYRSLKAPNAIRCKEFQVISPILDADIIIDIGKLKTHCMTGMSGAVKNMFGVVPGLMKPELHCRFPDKKEFSEMLVDLCEARMCKTDIVHYGRCLGYGRQRPFRRKTKVYRNLNRRNQSLCGRYGLRLYNLVKTFRHFYACFCYGTRPLSKNCRRNRNSGFTIKRYCYL